MSERRWHDIMKNVSEPRTATAERIRSTASWYRRNNGDSELWLNAASAGTAVAVRGGSQLQCVSFT